MNGLQADDGIYNNSFYNAHICILAYLFFFDISHIVHYLSPLPSSPLNLIFNPPLFISYFLAFSLTFLFFIHPLFLFSLVSIHLFPHQAFLIFIFLSSLSFIKIRVLEAKRAHSIKEMMTIHFMTTSAHFGLILALRHSYKYILLIYQL